MAAHTPQRWSVETLWRLTDPFVPPHLFAEGGLPLLQARLLIVFCWLFVATALFAVVPRVLQPGAALVEIAVFLGYAALAAVAPCALRYTGRTTLVGVFVATTGMIAAISGAMSMEGLFSASIIWAAMLPLLTAFLIGNETAILAIAISSAVFLGVAITHAVGWHDPRPIADLVHRSVNLISLTIFSALIARLHEWSAAQARAGEQEAQQLVQIVSRRMGVGTLLLDRGEVRLANAAAEALLGHPEGSLTGRRWSEVFPASHPAATALADEAPSQVAEFDSRVAELDVHTPRAAGNVDPQRRRVELRVDTIHTPNGAATLITAVDITTRWQMEQAQAAAQRAVTASLREKETLIREIHHRVKNNLQIISSLLSLQSEHMPSPEAKNLLEESVQRVRSMALIHQQLYGMESLSRIEFADYARSLSESLRAAMAPDVRLAIDAAPVELTVEIAVPLGLILNELLTNAIKYGKCPADRAEGRAGPDCDVRVAVRVDGDTLCLTVTDSGVGLPADYRPASATSLGMQLVRTLSRQLRGQLTIDSDHGARFELRCPLSATV